MSLDLSSRTERGYRAMKIYTIIGGVNGFVEVAEYVNGELIPKGDYRPRWLQELLQIVNS